MYSKPLALYLYLPPHSCHAPGVLTGLVFGMILRIHRLCSKEEDVDKPEDVNQEPEADEAAEPEEVPEEEDKRRIPRIRRGSRF